MNDRPVVLFPDDAQTKHRHRTSNGSINAIEGGTSNNYNNTKMIAKEDENDNEVRREDQDRINQFARLNARLQDNKSEREQIKVRWIVDSFVRSKLTCSIHLKPTRCTHSCNEHGFSYILLYLF